MKKIRTQKNVLLNSDKVFDIVNDVVLVVLLLVFLWPLWFMVIASISDFQAVSTGNVILLPKDMHLEGYKKVFENEAVFRGYANTIFYSVVGTVVNIFMTVCCAYPLSVKAFKPRKYIMYALMFTMYFGGGLIPTYLIVKGLHLLDTPWVMIIPGAVSFYNCLIVRSYFMNSVPEELYEATILDGGGLFQYLMKVLLPLSKPVLAVVTLYYFVGHWNDYYTALIYIYDEKLNPLQSVLKNILMNVQMLSNNAEQMQAMLENQNFYELFKESETMKYSLIIVSLVPVMILYPFIQRYFIKGVMVGSVKG